MGKQRRTARGAEARQARAEPVSIGGGSGGAASFFDSPDDEEGLTVRHRKSGVIYLAIFGLIVFLSVGTVLSLGASTLPRLLSHWAWVLFTLFSTGLFTTRWFAPDVEAHVIFWGLLMVHGLLWLTVTLVLTWGMIAPGTLWDAFGQHGGAHLLITQWSSVLLLGIPLCALVGFMVWEHEYLVAVFYDFHSQLRRGHRKWNTLFQLLSPVLPLGVWLAFFRTTLFTDLPVWPGTLSVVSICCIANGPILYYIHYRSRFYQGSAHWFSGGVVLFSKGRSSFEQASRASPGKER